jgi:hypothetical protein
VFNLVISGGASLSGYTATYSTKAEDWNLIGFQSINL